MFNETRSEAVASLQVAKMGVIDLTTDNFSIPGKGFQLKNDGTTSVELEVKLLNMEDEDGWIKTVFDRGWNPEIIREVKQTATSNVNLKWGY